MYRKENHHMKRLLTILLGVMFLAGTVPATYAQDKKDDTKKNTKKKKGKKKTEGEKKGGL